MILAQPVPPAPQDQRALPVPLVRWVPQVRLALRGQLVQLADRALWGLRDLLVQLADRALWGLRDRWGQSVQRDQRGPRVRWVRLAERDLPVLPGQRDQLGQPDRRVLLDLQAPVLMAERNSWPPALSSCRLASAGSAWNSTERAEAEPLAGATAEGAAVAEPTRVQSCRSKRDKS